MPGTILGSRLAPRVPQSFIRRGIVVVLTMSGVALLDKSGWAPLGVEETHPLDEEFLRAQQDLAGR